MSNPLKREKSNQFVVIENEGSPDIANDIDKIEICTNNPVDGKFKRYKLFIDENGTAQLKCLGNYDEEEYDHERELFAQSFWK